MEFVNILNNLLSLFERGEKVMEIGKNIYNEYNMKRLDIQHILESVDENKIDIDEIFIVEGIISGLAPINEPKTYIDKNYKITDIIDKNKEKIYELTVNSYALPVSKFKSENEKSIAFLYKEDLKEAFVFDYDKKEDKQILSEHNKFMPILINNDLLVKNLNSKVELKVKIKRINNLEAARIFNYKNEKYNELVNLFYDPYNMKVNSIILEVVEIKSEITKNIDLGRYSFGVEYTVDFRDSITDINMEMGNACKDIKVEELKFNVFGVENGKGIVPCKRDVYVNIFENSIGFYIEIDKNDRNIYRSKIRELEKASKIVLKKLKLLGDVKISFISDEDKKSIFELKDNKN